MMDDQDFGREFSWAELFPSVFDRTAEFKPVFHPLGNEGGKDGCYVNWNRDPRAADVRTGCILVDTADSNESDVDEIEAHWSRIYFPNREAWQEAWRLARLIARGNKFVGCASGFIYEQPAGSVVDPAPRHIRSAA